MSEQPNGQPAEGAMTDHQGSRDFLPEESSLFQAPSLEGMFEIIAALADLIEAVQGFFAEIALENPAEMTTELTVYLLNLVRAAIKLRDMFGPLEDMQRPQPVGWPPAVRVQLNVLHNRVEELWTGLELNKAPSEALDVYRCGGPGPLTFRVEKRPGAIHDQCGTKYRLNPRWTGCEAVYASILKAALRLLGEFSYLVRRAAATENTPPAYRPDLAAKFLTAPGDFKALLTSCRELARRIAAATENVPPAHGRNPEGSSMGKAARETPSWDKESKVLSYKDKHTSLRRDAEARSIVFDWFQEGGWKKVKIQGLDIIEDAGRVSNLVRRANQTARLVGFVISRDGEELEWTDKG